MAHYRPVQQDIWHLWGQIPCDLLITWHLCNNHAAIELMLSIRRKGLQPRVPDTTHLAHILHYPAFQSFLRQLVSSLSPFTHRDADGRLVGIFKGVPQEVQRVRPSQQLWHHFCAQLHAPCILPWQPSRRQRGWRPP